MYRKRVEEAEVAVRKMLEYFNVRLFFGLEGVLPDVVFVAIEVQIVIPNAFCRERVKIEQN